MRLSAQARRQRDAHVRRLHGQGWPLRRIGRDPRVRLSAQGVADVLDRTAAEADRRDVDGLVLDWYRRGVVGGDPTAKLYFNTFKARVNQEMTYAAARSGVVLDDLDVVACQDLRRQAHEIVLAEMAEVVGHG